MPDLSRILKADRPLSLTSMPRGAQPLVMADLARAAKGRAVFIAPDEQAMRGVTDAARWFAPELQVIEFPAWDCLPYDRASPALSVSSRRLSALHQLQAGKTTSQLVVTTVNAVLQRVLTPFRIREAVRELKPGMTIGHESLTALLVRQGYSRTDTVIDTGEFAVRGSIFDLFPAGLDQALRLDFFGDELESLRLFDPGTQLTTGSVDGHLLLPASEALLDDDTIKRFRGRYRELFGANATQDPLYQAISEGRRLAGMEHWLPLLEERMATLFDHLGDDDLVVIDAAAIPSGEERLADVEDYYRQRRETAGQAAGSYRPLPADALYLSSDEWRKELEQRPVHRAVIFAEPESDKAIDFGFRSARDFAPERTRGDNVYEAAAAHFKVLGKAGKRPLLAAYSEGSMSRIASILGEAGTKMKTAASWQEALGAAAKGSPVAMVLPLDTGFANDELELVTEQDLLGDRLVRRRKRRKDSDAFLAELSALNRGDLVVHLDHGFGKYLGLEPVTVGQSQHDCVRLEYAGGDKLFIPVENIDVLSRQPPNTPMLKPKVDVIVVTLPIAPPWHRRRTSMRLGS